MARTNESISLDKKVTVHGIEIRKMPNGRYLSALALIKELPETFVKEVLEGETDFKLSDIFTVEKLVEVAGKLLCVLPDFTLRFLSELMDIKLEVLKEELSPLETLDIVEKFIEINKIDVFFTRMKPVVAKLMNLQTPTGFNTQLQTA